MAQDIIPKNPTAINTGNNDQRRKKKRSPLQILRVALYMLSLKSGKSSKSAHADVASTWKRLMWSMRPLHVNSNQSPPRIADAANNPAENCLPPIKVVGEPKPDQDLPFIKVSPQEKQPTVMAEEVVIEPSDHLFSAPTSPGQKSIASSSSGMTSQYASAVNLHELDDYADGDDSDRDDEDSFYDDKVGDEMIDMKAEQFIARFYAQMRLQQNRPHPWS